MVNLSDRDRQIINSLAKNNMNVSDVSREIFMHRNTVLYNLERIKRETGLNPMSFYDLIKLVGKEDADVAPVVHGEWKYICYEDGVHPKDVYACTNCGAEKKVVCRKYLEPEKWCYNCGCKMDGGKDSVKKTEKEIHQILNSN